MSCGLGGETCGESFLIHHSSWSKGEGWLRVELSSPSISSLPRSQTFLSIFSNMHFAPAMSYSLNVSFWGEEIKKRRRWDRVREIGQAISSGLGHFACKCNWLKWWIERMVSHVWGSKRAGSIDSKTSLCLFSSLWWHLINCPKLLFPLLIKHRHPIRRHLRELPISPANLSLVAGNVQ